MAPPLIDSRLAARPLLCLVTDRRRLPHALDSDGRTELVEFISRAASAGINVIQIRERDLDGASLYDLVHRSVRAVEGTRARIVVNDRIDVAIAGGAAGVHLRGDSPDGARVRRVTPAGFLIGRSVHSVEEAVAVTRDGALDYLIAGTIFPTRSKPDAREYLGPAGLRSVVERVDVPVLAIGGVTLPFVNAVATAGAAGFAAISLFFEETPGEELAQVVTKSRRAFDMPRSVP